MITKNYKEAKEKEPNMSVFIAKITLQSPKDSPKHYKALVVPMERHGFVKLDDGAQLHPAKYRYAEREDSAEYQHIHKTAETAISHTCEKDDYVLDLYEAGSQEHGLPFFN